MPVEVPSQADIGYQDEMWIGRYPTPGSGTPVFTQILGVETVAMPEKVPEDIDTTHMQSPGRSRESAPGLLAIGDLSQEMQFWPEDPGQIIVDELATLTEAGDREDIVLEMVVGGMRRSYRSYINSYTPTASIGAKRMANMSAKVFERLATNPRVVTP